MECQDKEVYVTVCRGEWLPLYELVAPQRSGGERVVLHVLPAYPTIACSDSCGSWH